MATRLNFANYDPNARELADIYDIGATTYPERSGVIPEIARAFDFELSDIPDVENLGQLIGKVGPAKQLQDNIPNVQAVLGTSESGVDIARGWARRSGLLTPVMRPLTHLEQPMQDHPIDVVVATGGVRNWMNRRRLVIANLARTHRVTQALLVAGKRPMRASEGPDVIDGMTEFDYMHDIVARRLASRRIAARVIGVDSEVGDDVMRAAAEALQEYVDPNTGLVAIASNAGAWLQNGGQLRRAAVATFGPQFDREGRNLLVASDGFRLGSGAEPTATHQNPFTATGQILRNAQELARQHALN